MGLNLPFQQFGARAGAVAALAGALHVEMRGLAGEINGLFEGRSESVLPARLAVLQRAAMYAGFWGVGVYFGSLVELAEQVLKLNSNESNSSDRAERAKVFSSGCNTLSAYLRDLAAGSVVSYMELNQAFGTVVRRARPMLLNLDAQQVSDLLYMAVPPTLELEGDWQPAAGASREALRAAVSTALLAGIPDVDAVRALAAANPIHGYVGLFEAFIAVCEHWAEIDPARQSLIHKDIQKQLGGIQADLADPNPLSPLFPDPFVFSALMAAVADIASPSATARALQRKFGLVSAGKAGALNQVARTFMQVLEKAVTNMAQAARTQTPKAAQRDAQELARNAAHLPSKPFGIFAARLDEVCAPWKEQGRSATEAEWIYAMAMLSMMRLAASTWGHQQSQDDLLEYAEQLNDGLDLVPSKTVQATVRGDAVTKLLRMMSKEADRVAHQIAEPLAHLQSGQADAQSALMAAETVGKVAGAALLKLAGQFELLLLPIAAGCARGLAKSLADSEAWGRPETCRAMVETVTELRVCIGRLRPASMLDMEPSHSADLSADTGEALPEGDLQACAVPAPLVPADEEHQVPVEALQEPAADEGSVHQEGEGSFEPAAIPEPSLVPVNVAVFTEVEVGEPIFEVEVPDFGEDVLIDVEAAGDAFDAAIDAPIEVEHVEQESPEQPAVQVEAIEPSLQALDPAPMEDVLEPVDIVEAGSSAAPEAPDFANIISNEHIDNSPEHLAGLIAVAATGPEEVLQGDEVLLTIFEEEATGTIAGIKAALVAATVEGSDEVVSEIRRLVHTLKGGARTCGLEVVGTILNEVESALELVEDDNLALAPFLHVLSWSLDEVDKRVGGAFAARSAVMAASVQAPAPEESVSAAQPTEWAEPVAEQGLAPEAQQAPVPAAEAAQWTAAPVVRQKPAQAGGTVRIPVSVATEVGQASGSLLAATRDSVERFAHVDELLGGLSGLVARIRPIAQDLKLFAQTSTLGATTGAGGHAGGFDEIELERSTALQDLVQRLTEAVEDIADTSGSLAEAVKVARKGEDELAQVAVDLQRRSSELMLVPVEVQRVRLENVLKLACTDSGKAAELIVDRAARVPSAVLDKLMPALEHLLRNTVAHGIEPADVRAAAGKAGLGTVRIGVPQGGKVEGGLVRISVRDDGAGLDLAKIRTRAIEKGILDANVAPSNEQLADLIFSPGFSTAQSVTQLSGRGVGLDVVRSTMAAIGGSVFVRFRANQGTEFVLTIPADSSSMTVIPVEAAGYQCMVPASLVNTILPLAGTSHLSVDWAAGLVRRNGMAFALRDLRRHVPGTVPAGAPSRGHLLFMQGAAGLQAVFVDSIRPQRRVLTKALGIGLINTPGLLAATQAASTGVSLVVNPLELPALMEDESGTGGGVEAGQSAKTVLVVDDSATVRLATARLLEGYGFQVLTAVHGQDALDQLAAGLTPSAILCDLEMPVMNGFELLRALKANPRTASTPAIVISSRSTQKHQSQAIDLGAAAYLSKPVDDFQLRRILDTAIAK